MVYRPSTQQTVDLFRRLFLPLSLVLLGLVLFLAYLRPFSSAPAVIAKANPFSISFIANEGQTDTAVRYMAQNQGMGLFFTDEGLTFAGEGARVGWQFVGANTAEIVGENILPGMANYLYGSDAERWRTGLPTFGTVTYAGLYPGVDVAFNGNSGQLEATYELEAGVDPAVLQWQFEGGTLAIEAESGIVQILDQDEENIFSLHPPRVFQQDGKSSNSLKSGYKIDEDGILSLTVLDFDPSQTMSITIPSEFLGVSGWDEGTDVATDTGNNMYLVGSSWSTEFPLINPMQPANAGFIDGFVSKFSADGSQLIYSTYIGGSLNDHIRGVEIDSDGNVYIIGVTFSSDFPLVNPIHIGLDASEVFVSKLSADGSQLLFSTFLGGSEGDGGNDIVLNSQNDIYIVGFTDSPDFPLVNPVQPVYQGGAEIFISKISGSTFQLLYSTYLGGSSDDYVTRIDLDAMDNMFLTGKTRSTDFPVVNTSIPIPPTGVLPESVIATKLSSDGSSLLYSAMIGGSDLETGHGISVDGIGNAYITGETHSDDFPMVMPTQNTLNGVIDSFLLKIEPGGNNLLFSTYLGGSANDLGYAITQDPGGEIFMTGLTYSPDFPILNPLATPPFNQADVFISSFSTTGEMLFSTYLGGSGVANGIVIDGLGRVIVGGSTNSPDFPTVNAFQSEIDVAPDAFITRLNADETALDYSTYLGGGYPDPTDVTLSEFGKEAESPANLVFLMGGLLTILAVGFLLVRRNTRQ